ncbi:clavesin-2-like [Tribolium madens]|uniref:clavesin-2-like n=1 Tax=Tribolium madens TaxID=41895 RepID=UPI001CF7462C|nr:clavesin-2-like [Tribolium madens]
MAEYLQYDWRLEKIVPEPPPRSEPQDKTLSVQALRTMIQQSTDLELKNNVSHDDKTLLKFLFARKFNIPDSYLLVQNYYYYRKKNHVIFENFTSTAPDIKNALESSLPGVLPSKDRKGRCVLILNATNWDCDYSLISIYRAILLSLDHLVNEVHNQARGFVVIVDWTEFSFRQSTNLKPSILKLMIEGLQDCFPAKFKGIHFIGQPWYVEAALTFIKPFLKEKIKERIFVHGNNLSTLHDYVHKDILPAELGGEQPSYNPEIWIKTLRGE